MQIDFGLKYKMISFRFSSPSLSITFYLSFSSVHLFLPQALSLPLDNFDNSMCIGYRLLNQNICFLQNK